MKFEVIMVLALAVGCGGWTKHYSFRHREVGTGVSGVSVPVDLRKTRLWDAVAEKRTNRCETTIVTGVKCVNAKTRVIREKPKKTDLPPRLKQDSETAKRK